MAFNGIGDSINKKFLELSTKTQEVTSSIPHVAQHTSRLVKETFGQTSDISELPPEYLELEQQIDVFKDVYEHFLKVTSVYEKESYDYPKEFFESFNDFTGNVATKMQGLSLPGRASHMSPPLYTEHTNPNKIPETLNFALSKVSQSCSEKFKFANSAENTSLSELLLHFSYVQSKIAEARLHQDHLIQVKFNYQLREELSQHIERANKYRKEVHSKRLRYDVARTNYESGKPEKKAILKVQMEIIQDEFNQATKDAILVMQEIITNSKFEQELKQMAVSQLSYHSTSSDILKAFLETVTNPAATYVNEKEEIAKEKMSKVVEDQTTQTKPDTEEIKNETQSVKKLEVEDEEAKSEDSDDKMDEKSSSQAEDPVL